MNFLLWLIVSIIWWLFSFTFSIAIIAAIFSGIYYYHYKYIRRFKESKKQVSFINKRIEKLQTLVDKNKFKIACGSDHTLLVDSAGYCWSWGNNSYGQLGLDHIRQINNKPVAIANFLYNRVSFVACGKDHSSCITQNGECFVWGRNKYGQLGFDNNPFLHRGPTMLTMPSMNKVVYITCGANHTCCLTIKGEWYIWGKNKQGQLGFDDLKNRYRPTIVDKHDIVLIKLGYKYSICLTQDKKLYAWGKSLFDHLCYSSKLQLVDSDVRRFECGYYRVMYQKTNYEWYGCGYNLCGELGLENEDPDTRWQKPQKITIMGKNKIASVVCNGATTVLMDNYGLCYILGNDIIHGIGFIDPNVYKLSKLENQLIFRGYPLQITSPDKSKIISTYLGKCHIIIVSEKGNIFVGGYNYYGQLGIETSKMKEHEFLHLRLDSLERIFEKVTWTRELHAIYSDESFKELILIVFVYNLRIKKHETFQKTWLWRLKAGFSQLLFLPSEMWFEIFSFLPYKIK